MEIVNKVIKFFKEDKSSYYKVHHLTVYLMLMLFIRMMIFMACKPYSIFRPVFGLNMFWSVIVGIVFSSIIDVIYLISRVKDTIVINDAFSEGVMPIVIYIFLSNFGIYNGCKKELLTIAIIIVMCLIAVLSEDSKEELEIEEELKKKQKTGIILSIISLILTFYILLFYLY